MRLSKRTTSATALAACLALCLAPAAAHAAFTTFGSDLTKNADTYESFGPDVAFWNTMIDGNPNAGRAPADGQVTLIRLKGNVPKDGSRRGDADPQFHFQTLHPTGGGQVKVMLTAGVYHLPIGGDPQRINSYQPINLCVHAGDYIDFNDYGGAEWAFGPNPGITYQVFAAARTSTVDFYSKNAGTNNGDQFSGQTRQGEELLLQSTLATGPDATDICPGGFMQHVFEGVQIKRQTISVSRRKRTAKLTVLCPNPSYGRCRGLITLKGTVKGKPVTFGGAPFSVLRAYTGHPEVRLSKQGLKMLKKAKKVTATVTADSQDDPRHDKRADRSVPVQSKTTTGRVTLRASR